MTSMTPLVNTNTSNTYSMDFIVLISRPNDASERIYTLRAVSGGAIRERTQIAAIAVQFVSRGCIFRVRPSHFDCCTTGNC